MNTFLYLLFKTAAFNFADIRANYILSVKVVTYFTLKYKYEWKHWSIAWQRQYLLDLSFCWYYMIMIYFSYIWEKYFKLINALLIFKLPGNHRSTKSFTLPRDSDNWDSPKATDMQETMLYNTGKAITSTNPLLIWK